MKDAKNIVPVIVSEIVRSDTIAKYNAPKGNRVEIIIIKAKIDSAAENVKTKIGIIFFFGSIIDSLYNFRTHKSSGQLNLESVV